MQHFLLKSKVVQEFYDAVALDEPHTVSLLVSSNSPEQECAAKDNLLEAQRQELPARHEAMQKAVKECKVTTQSTAK